MKLAFKDFKPEIKERRGEKGRAGGEKELAPILTAPRSRPMAISFVKVERLWL